MTKDAYASGIFLTKKWPSCFALMGLFIWNRKRGDMKCQVELSKVAKNFGSFRAVDDVNLSINDGDLITLLGPSGCGKTTTLRMIAGLFRPDSGYITIAGKDVTAVPPYRRDVSMVFQNYALFPHLTVFENVVFGLRTRKVKDPTLLHSKARAVLDIVRLENVENRYPRQLSGGQQQRVSLARALIVNPKVMLFDEPLSNLDAKLRIQTRTEIRSLLKNLNITAVYVTHDQEEALAISDHIAVMNRGRIEQISTPRNLYDRPETRFVAEFIGNSNLFVGRVEGGAGGEITVSTDDGFNVTLPATGAEGRTWIPGDRVLLLLRSECLRVRAAGERPEPNAVTGRMLDKSFLGSIIRYRIGLDNGRCVTLDTHPEAEVALPEGRPVEVFWNPERIVVLRQ